MNVKKIVGLFEAPSRTFKASSSVKTNPPRLGQYVHRRTVPSSRRPPVPEGAASLQRPSLGKERKLYGKTHPLDRLTPGGRQKLAQPIFGTM